MLPTHLSHHAHGLADDWPTDMCVALPSISSSKPFNQGGNELPRTNLCSSMLNGQLTGTPGVQHANTCRPVAYDRAASSATARRKPWPRAGGQSGQRMPSGMGASANQLLHTSVTYRCDACE
jgi:hypothetical protein